ncbi:efflux transporter outer membrane subunit [Vibrio astriarenae]|uniref:efflux transporter outer membrane subunit n=1 Tax=Vibrio astriarenae TaxID=1481923 RepID=UPI003735383C
MKMLKPLFLLLSIGLTACSSVPNDTEQLVSLSTSYMYEDERYVTRLGEGDSWWQSFDDPILNELVARAQQQNITLKVASENIIMAQSYQAAVSSLKVPTIALGAGYNHIGLSENEAFAGPIVGTSVMGQSLVDSSAGNYLVGASVAWEMDLFGRIDAMTMAASVRAEQAGLARDGLTIVITGEVISNYFEMRSAQQRRVIVQKSVEQQKEVLIRVERLLKSGMASQLEVARSQAMLAQTEALIPQLETAETIHKQRLAILLSDQSEAFFAMLSDSNELPTFSGLIPVGLPSEILKNRPDVRAAELEVSAQNYELGAALASQYPSFYLSGTPGLVAKNFDDLFSSDSIAWTAGVGVKWNLFDGGRTQSLIELNEARLNSAVLNYQHSVNTAISEVEMLLKAYGDNHQYHRSMREAQQYGVQAFERAQALYSAGLIDQIELLDAQRQLLYLDERELLARSQSAQLVVQLHKALGGDWRDQVET